MSDTTIEVSPDVYQIARELLFKCAVTVSDHKAKNKGDNQGASVIEALTLAQNLVSKAAESMAEFSARKDESGR